MERSNGENAEWARWEAVRRKVGGADLEPATDGSWDEIHDRLAPEDARVGEELWARIRAQRARLRELGAWDRCYPGTASRTIKGRRKGRR